MSRYKLKAPTPRRRRPPPQSPFPVSTSSLTTLPPGDDNWNYYLGRLLHNAVIISHSGDIDHLYKMGGFGKASLSRFKPEYHQRATSKQKQNQEHLLKVTSRRKYLRHCFWGQLKNAEDGVSDEIDHGLEVLPLLRSKLQTNDAPSSLQNEQDTNLAAQQISSNPEQSPDKSHEKQGSHDLWSHDNQESHDPWSRDNQGSHDPWSSDVKVKDPWEISAETECDPWADNDQKASSDFWALDKEEHESDQLQAGENTINKEGVKRTDSALRSTEGQVLDPVSKDGHTLSQRPNEYEMAAIQSPNRNQTFQSQEKVGVHSNNLSYLEDPKGQRQKRKRQNENKAHCDTHTKKKFVGGTSDISENITETSFMKGCEDITGKQTSNEDTKVNKECCTNIASGKAVTLSSEGGQLQQFSESKIGLDISLSPKSAFESPHLHTDPNDAEVKVDSSSDMPDADMDTEVQLDPRSEHDDANPDLYVRTDTNENACEESESPWRPAVKKDPYPLKEHLYLSLEEAFFLSFGLGCLIVINEKQEAMSLGEMWKRYCSLRPDFPYKYAVYHNLRSKGWVPKQGLKYGVDFVVYKQGPAYYHSSYCVQIQVIDEKFMKEIDGLNNRRITWASLAGLNRVTEQVAKEVMLCYVLKPFDMTDDELCKPDCIKRFKIQETVVQRWIWSQEREDRSKEQDPS